MKLKLSDSQNLVLQGLLSILVASVLTALAAGVQEVAAHGVDIPTLLSLMIAAFGASFGLALKNFVPQHAAQELQAYKDLNTQLQQALHIQQTTPPIVNVQVPQAPQAPLQGLMRQAPVRPITSQQQPQQAFPAPSVASVPVPPQPQTAVAGTVPITSSFTINSNPAFATQAPAQNISTDTTPRVAALLAQMQQGQQQQ